MADKSPDDFYKTHLGKSFDYDGSWGAQCVEGFYAFGRYMGFVIPTGVGSAKYYANSNWQRTLSKWFVYLPASAPIQNGDWVIWPNGTHGHVAMYYGGKSFGQNQHGNGNGHAFTLDPWNFSNRSCAYRVKTWAGQSWGTAGGSAAVNFIKYNLSDGELRGIARLCQQEQGSPKGAAAEASLMANRFELFGSKYKSLYFYVRDSKWFARASYWMSLNPRDDILAAVKDVLVNGNRTLPNYVDEHDCFSDISKLSTGGSVSNRSAYIQDKTIVYNRYGAQYTFYCFPTTSSDPFGYTANAKKIAAQKGLNGTIGSGDISEAGIYTPLYITKNDRHDATMREVAYIDPTTGDTKKSSTKVPLSVINYTSALADAYDELASQHGLLPTDENASWEGKKVDTSKVTPALAKRFIDSLLKLGCNPIAACGIAGNIEAECAWNPSLVEGSGKGPGVGICQWTSQPRKNNFLSAVPDWKTNFEGQVNFMWTEITMSYKASRALTEGKVINPKEVGGVTSMKGYQYKLPEPMNTGDTLKLNERSVVIATEVFMCDYERPGIPHEDRRYNEAKRIFKQLKFIENNPTVGSVNLKNGIKSRSGQILTLGKSVDIPSSVKQSGIIADITIYQSQSWTGTAKKVFDLWKSSGSKNNGGLATIDGYYLVALRDKVMGVAGDCVVVILENGITIPCVMADEKGEDATSPYGHVKKTGVSVVEWQSTTRDLNAINRALKQLGWYGRNVAKVINYGKWL